MQYSRTNIIGWQAMPVGSSFDGLVESPIKGAKGNKEFLIHFGKP